MKNIYAFTEVAYTQPAYISVNAIAGSTKVRFTVREQGKEYGSNIELSPEQCEHLAVELIAHINGDAAAPTPPAQPAERVPLTLDELSELVPGTIRCAWSDFVSIARAIEQAHGITAPNPQETTRSESLIHAVNHVVEPREGE